MSAYTRCFPTTIKCPECGKICNATVLASWPWPTYIHHCEHCQYIIMESDWNAIIDEYTRTQHRYAPQVKPKQKS